MTVTYWEPSELMKLAYALEDIESGNVSFNHVAYDPQGAPTPEEAELPMSYWSKERILDYILTSKILGGKYYQFFKDWKLDDLRANALRYIGTMPTGKLNDMRLNDDNRQWRHTRYYSLDVDNIRGMVV